MTRHRTDPFALLFGLAFALAGLALFGAQFTDTTPGPRWTVAVGLILLGSVTLIATIASGLRGRDESPVVEPPPPDPVAPAAVPGESEH